MLASGVVARTGRQPRSEEKSGCNGGRTSSNRSWGRPRALVAARSSLGQSTLTRRNEVGASSACGGSTAGRGGSGDGGGDDFGGRRCHGRDMAEVMHTGVCIVSLPAGEYL